MKTIWTSEDEKKFLDLLLERKASAGDGGNFKETCFQEVSDILTALVTRGGPKTVKACQNKWSQLRKTFRVINAIKSVSGWTWNDETGANITPELESSWTAYIKIHKDAKPFKNHGWCHLDVMSQLMPSSIRGAHIFRPSDSSVGLVPFTNNDTMDNTSVSSLVSVSESWDSPPTDPSSKISSLEVDSDNESVDITQVVIMTPRHSRKRTSVAPPSTAPLAKRSKLTSASALDGLATSLSHFGDAIVKALAPVPSDAAITASCRTKAVLRAQALEKDLATPELLALINLLEKDSNAVDVYLALDDDQFCKAWVRMKVDSFCL
ncbi:hypothetical protein C0992_006807 [Termitomyces sp. T32_za158]|nr:hypothetical protein C0992_006807 [Termitomyces sp. T32_za158]